MPYFGICLGMQLMAIEFARHVLGIKNAFSGEFVPNPLKKSGLVINFMAGQWNKDKGGTMRLGSYPCKLAKGSKAAAAYGAPLIEERHRHRLEFQNEFRARFEKGGMRISGECPKPKLVEILELKDHPWFLGCQFHPEFKSRPEDPHPLFRDFVGASIKARESASTGA